MKKDQLKQYILKSLYKLGGESFSNRLSRVVLAVKYPNGKETLKHFGVRNPDKTFYVIRKEWGRDEGLLSMFTYVMGRVDYADRNGMIPYVAVDHAGEPSVFNRYFKLKNAISEDEIYSSKNVVLSGYDCKPVYPGWCNWINTDFNKQKRALFDKYIESTDIVLEQAEQARNQINPSRCLGLYMRGTDYLSLRPAGHPIQPALDDLIPYIDAFLEEEKLEGIFLMTEDESIRRQVSERYGAKVCTLEEDRFCEDYQFGEDIKIAMMRSGSLDDNNLLYLIKTIILSECHSFVGGRTNGSSVACALNGGKYKRKFVYNVGVYE